MAAKKKITPKKKPVSRTQTKKRKVKKAVVFKEFKKIFVGIAILLSVCLTIAMIADLFFQPGRPGKEKKTVTMFICFF